MVVQRRAAAVWRGLVASTERDDKRTGFRNARPGQHRIDQGPGEANEIPYHVALQCWRTRPGASRCGWRLVTSCYCRAIRATS